MSEKQAKRRRRENNGPKRCVMCGAVAKRSEEHLLPRWLLDCIDPALLQGKAAFVDCTIGGSANGFLPKDLIHGKGCKQLRKSVTRVSARIVCRQCNSGWMGEVENDLRWLKDFFRACNGDMAHAEGVIHQGQLSATMVDEAKSATLSRWGAMKAATLGLGWNALGHLALRPEQLEAFRALALSVRRDELPPGLEVELVQTFVPHVPLGCGVVMFGRSFVFIIKVQAFWLRVILDHPDEDWRMMRMAFLGPLIRPWRRESEIATVARVEHFECQTSREEQLMLTEGVVPSPIGFNWTNLQDSPMPMQVYREFIPKMRDILRAWTAPKEGRQAGGQG